MRCCCVQCLCWHTKSWPLRMSDLQKKSQVLMLSKQAVWIVWELKGCAMERLWFCSVFSWVLVHSAMTVQSGNSFTHLCPIGHEPHVSASGLISRRSVFWFSGGYTKQDLVQTAHCLSVHHSLFCFLYFGFVSGINKCVVITDLIQMLLEYLIALDLPESEAYFPLLTSIFKILWNITLSSSLLLCLEPLFRELPPSHK